MVLVAAALVVFVLAWAMWPRPSTQQAGGEPASAPAVTPLATSVAVSATPSITASPTPTGPVDCDPTATQVSVAGFKEVKASSRQVFTVSVLNGGPSSCILDVRPSTFQLSVASGSDQIWTTAHCAKWLPSKTLTLAPQKAHEFTITWPMVRSSAGCGTSKATVRPGTYVATAQYRDTATARQVMQVTK